MKLTLQIALGVFLGILSSKYVLDIWHQYQENTAKSADEKLRAEQEQIRKEQGERIRNLILQNRKNNQSSPQNPPPGFVPDDAQVH